MQVTRHSEGPAGVFGVDNFTLNLGGKLVGKIASFTARANEVPDMVLEGTLIRREQEDVPVKPRRTISMSILDCQRRRPAHGEIYPVIAPAYQAN